MNVRQEKKTMTVKDLHDLYVKTYDKEYNKQGYTVDHELSLSLVEDLEEYLNVIYQKGYNAGRAIYNQTSFET